MALLALLINLLNLRLFLYSVGIFLAFLLIFEHSKKKNSYRDVSRKVPTIYGLPFIGIGYQFLPLRKFLYVIGGYFDSLRTSTYFAWLGMNPFVITVDPEIVKIILTSEEFLIKARSIYTSIDNALPNGIMTSNGEKWRHNRRLMNFSFSHKILKDLMPIFNKGAEKIAHQMGNLDEEKEHDIFGLMKKIILQTAVETTMGIVLQDGEKMDEKLASGFNFMLQEVACEMIYNSVHLGFLVHTPKYYKTNVFLRSYAANLINTKFATKDSNKNLDKTSDRNSETEQADHEIFIKQAIDYKDRGLFDLNDVISETHTMIAGSFDTVSTTIYSIIMLLAMHEDVQEKLFTEVCNVLPFKRTEIIYEDIKEAPYMDMVINETLRLMPSIPVIGRETERDIKITEDINLPKGMQVMIPIFTLHRRKDIWGPKAELFDPDNFLPERIESRHPYAYIPFSKGLRNCLGIRYAHITLRVLLLRLVRSFKFSTSFKYENLIFIDKLSLRYDVEPKIQIQKRIQ